MKLITTALVLLSLAVVSPAYSATEQHNKMATCNKDATGKKGEERKAFM
ncbi:MAG: PsiF family protein, partial [bacterium]